MSEQILCPYCKTELIKLELDKEMGKYYTFDYIYYCDVCKKAFIVENNKVVDEFIDDYEFYG